MELLRRSSFLLVETRQNPQKIKPQKQVDEHFSPFLLPPRNMRLCKLLLCTSCLSRGSIRQNITSCSCSQLFDSGVSVACLNESPRGCQLNQVTK